MYICFVQFSFDRPRLISPDNENYKASVFENFMAVKNPNLYLFMVYVLHLALNNNKVDVISVFQLSNKRCFVKSVSVREIGKI